MATEVRMPQLSQSVVEGEISRWRVAEGDRVELDQVLAEIGTDKVDVEMPSPVAGTVLQLLVAEGETVAIGTPLLVIGEAGESAADGATAASAVYSSLSASLVGGGAGAKAPDGRPAPEPPAAAGGGTAAVRATPAVRSLARELGVDLAAVRGSGPGGRITAEDVRRAAAGEA